jgi:hypothetical protein
MLSLSVYMIVFNKEIPSVDMYYNNFNSIHNGSFITGTSRGRYALSFKKSNFKNFSFTRSISPYNDSYTNFLLKVIEQKMGEISILTVSPLSLGDDVDVDYFSKFNFQKNDFKKINFKYLIKEKITPVKIIKWNIKELYRKIIFGEDYSKDDRDSSVDTIYFNKKISTYSIPQNFSPKRIKNLKKLINHFKKTSTVILVRLPIPEKMYLKENNSVPTFTKVMDSISKKNDVDYIDMNKIDFYPELIFYDVHHLNKKESIRVSQTLIDTITRTASMK